MSLSQPNNPPSVNEGAAKLITNLFGGSEAENQTKINQIHGINPVGSTGAGIPKAVTNVTAAVANASVGSTSTVTVRFQRDPSDTSFAGVKIYAKGYQGNNSPVQVGASSDSPATVILNNTGESVSLIVQSVGNGGVSPIASSPTYGLKLPKNATGGVGTRTTTNLTTVQVQQIAGGGQQPIATVNSAIFYGPGIWPNIMAGITTVNAGEAVTDAANRVYAYQFVLPIPVTLRQLIWQIASGNLGEVVSFGIYDSTRTVVKQVSITHAAGQNVYTTSFSDLTLQPGVYWFAQTSSGTTVNGMNLDSGYGHASGFAPGVFQQGGYVGAVLLAGIAANAATLGILPSTLGAISAAPFGNSTQVCAPLWAS